MTELKTWLPTVRRYGFDFGRDEPSHIHLPRRRRRAGVESQAGTPTWPADVGADERCAQAPSVAAEA